VTAKLFYAGGKIEGRMKRQTDVTKFRETFCNFANTSKNSFIIG
jgi:hypothetical protein